MTREKRAWVAELWQAETKFDKHKSILRKSTVEVRKKLWQSSASERAAGGKVKLLHDKLKIGNRIYVWDQEKNERCLFRTEQDKTRPKGRKGKSASQNQQRPPTSGQNSGTESDSSQP